MLSALKKQLFVVYLLFQVNVNANFAEVGNLDGQSDDCKQTVENINSEFPELSNCYSMTNLYFSTVGNVCSDTCRDVTTKASKRISDACNGASRGLLSILPNSNNSPAADTSDEVDFIGDPSKRMELYGRWSKETINNVACSKSTNPTGRNQLYCLEALFSAHEFVTNMDYMPIPAGKTKEQNAIANLCNSCVKSMYQVLKTPNNEPSLYYWNFRNSAAMFQAIRLYCKY